MSNYQNLISEGHGTFDVKTLAQIENEIKSDKAFSTELTKKEEIWANESSKAKNELIILIGLERANRAHNHYQSWPDALKMAKTQIAAGKCKAV